MKTGEEKFDDEIRQKLRYSEATPPADFFNQVVPPDNSKRTIFWIWFAGVLLLLVTAGWYQFNNQGKLPRTHNAPVENSSTNSTQVSSKDKIERENLPAKDELIYKPANDNVTQTSTQGNHSSTSTSLTGSINAGDNSGEVGNTTPEAFHPSPKREPGSSSSASENKNTRERLKHNSETPAYGNANNTKATAGMTPVYNYDLLFKAIPSLPYNGDQKIIQQLKTVKPDSRKFISHIPTPWSVELVASRTFNTVNKKLEADDAVSNELFEQGNSVAEAVPGFDIVGKVLYALNKRFSAGAGIAYAHRQEQIRFNYREDYTLYTVDTSLYYILFPFTPPQPVYDFDTTFYQMFKDHPINHDLTFKTFSASAELRYEIPFGNFLIEPNIGIVADVFQQVSGNTNYNINYEETSGEKHYEKNIQARILGGIQVGYTLSEKFNLFLQSQYRYALNPMNTSPKFYSERMNQVFVGTGIKYTIFKREAAKPNVTGSELVKN